MLRKDSSGSFRSSYLLFLHTHSTNFEMQFTTDITINKSQLHFCILRIGIVSFLYLLCCLYLELYLGFPRYLGFLHCPKQNTHSHWLLVQVQFLYTLSWIFNFCASQIKLKNKTFKSNISIDSPFLFVFSHISSTFLYYYVIITYCSLSYILFVSLQFMSLWSVTCLVKLLNTSMAFS